MSMDKIDALWRSQLRDGYVYELNCATYVSDWMDVDDGKGGVVPAARHRVVWIVSTYDARRLESDIRAPHQPDVSEA